MRKFLNILASLVIVAAFASCGSGDRKAEGGDVTHEQLEQAHLAGREAARVFISRQWKDSLQLQEQLIEAASNAAPFDSVIRLRAAYDSAFISTIRTVRPEIAAQLEKYQKEHSR